MRAEGDRLARTSARACATLTFAALLAACASTAPQRPDAGADATESDPDIELLETASVSLKQGIPADAVALADQVIAHHEARYPASVGQRIYCTRRADNALVYMIVAASKGQHAIVIGPTWADAYLIKGYALVEMGQLMEGRAALQQAVELSPDEPQYLSELAYTFQATHDVQRALETYQRAERAAATIKDPADQRFETGRALRGEGYAFAELGRWDDAEKAYLRCLELDPADKAAARELEYVRANRPAAGSR